MKSKTCFWGFSATASLLPSLKITRCSNSYFSRVFVSCCCDVWWPGVIIAIFEYYSSKGMKITRWWWCCAVASLLLKIVSWEKRFKSAISTFLVITQHKRRTQYKTFQPWQRSSRSHFICRLGKADKRLWKWYRYIREWKKPEGLLILRFVLCTHEECGSVNIFPTWTWKWLGF